MDKPDLADGIEGCCWGQVQVSGRLGFKFRRGRTVAEPPGAERNFRGELLLLQRLFPKRSSGMPDEEPGLSGINAPLSRFDLGETFGDTVQGLLGKGASPTSLIRP